MLSPFRDFTEDERAIFQRHLDEFYRGFVAKVADSRNLTEAAADSVARGRVWSGRAAFEHGLVDTLGGVEAAFALARRAMNVPIDEPIRLERYPQRSRTFLQKMMETLVGDEERDGADAALELFPSSVRRWAVLALLAPARPLAVLPFAIEIR
jgi:protease-4